MFGVPQPEQPLVRSQRQKNRCLFPIDTQRCPVTQQCLRCSLQMLINVVLFLAHCGHVQHKPSPALKDLRNNRRQTADTVTRKELSFHIRKLHRQELRLWRSTKLSAYLCNPSAWKMLRVTWRNMLPTTSGPLVVPHSDVDVQGTSHCWSSSKHLGHYATELLQVYWWQGMRTGGQICCHSSYSFAPNHEQDHLKGIHVCIALLFSPVPFTGCLRAYRFHLTSPHIQHMQPSHE